MKRTLALLFVLALLLSLAVPALAAEDYELLFSNMNGEKVQSGPPKVKQFTFRGDPALIHQITTYHYNNRNGTEAPGTISIWEGDTKLGEWQATGRSYNGIDNLYWDIYPDFVMLPDHSYVVRVSDHDSWSYNEDSSNCGMLELYGSYVPGYVAPGGYDEVVTYRDIKIVLDGTLIIPRDANGDVVDPFILNGTTYLPLRAVAGALGLGIQWDGPTSTITLTSGAAKAANYGESSGNVGTALYTLVYRGIKIILDGALITPRDASGNVVEPFIIDGTTYLPVRALSNALGFDVGWDNATSTVSISSGASSGGSQSGGSGWVMIYEKATQTPDYESTSGIYFDTYFWEKDEEKGLIRGYSKQEAKPDDPTRNYQCTQFETTCTLPPKSGAPGEKVTFDLTAALVETISDQYYFGASCSIQTAAPGSGPDVAGRYCWNVLDEGADWDYHLNTPTAGIGGGNIDPGDSCTVFWRFPQNPQPGDRTSVYFRTNAVQIEWCYEYREGGVPAEPGNGGSQSGGDSRPGGNSWALIYEDTTQKESGTEGMYANTYTWWKDEEKGLMCHDHINEALGDTYQKTETLLTSTLPPKYGAPGDKITFDIAATLVDTNIAKYYFGDSSEIMWALPGKAMGASGTVFWNILDEGTDYHRNLQTPNAGTGGGNINYGDSCTVFWYFPSYPQPGDRWSVYFCSYGVQTEWCYEYQG